MCKWNLIKHEKAKYRKFLYTACQMDYDDEYSLHHEYSPSVTEADQENISLLVDYILERGNPFNTDKPSEIFNIATGTKLNEEESQFLLHCISLGESARDEFYESRLKVKTTNLFDTIPKTRKTAKKKTLQTVYDVNKETVKFLRNIDYSRLRNFDLGLLLKYGITPTSFYLMKDGFICKSQKSELARELKNRLSKQQILASLPLTDHRRAVVIDFMGYARKVPVKKQNLKTYRDFVVHLWNTFQSLSETCSCIDIVFDLYLDQSIKAGEHSRRTKIEGIETYISNIDQPLPIEIDRFWPVSKNKVALQQAFIQWIIAELDNTDFDKQIFLGGSHKEGETRCFSLCNGTAKDEPLLKCTHEEADD